MKFEYSVELKKGYRKTMETEETTEVRFVIETENRVTADRMVKALLDGTSNIETYSGFCIDRIEEEAEPDGMTISKLHEAGLVKDSTKIIVRTGLFGVVAHGNWYMDNILEYMNKELESFTWQDDEKLYVDLKEVEE